MTLSFILIRLLGGNDHLPLPGVLDDVSKVYLNIPDPLLQLGIRHVGPAGGAPPPDVLLGLLLGLGDHLIKHLTADVIQVISEDRKKMKVCFTHLGFDTESQLQQEQHQLVPEPAVLV